MRLRMNQKGNLYLFIFLGMLVVALLPTVVMHIFPQAKIVFQIMMIFIIYSMVRSYLGSGVLTILISAILIYFLVFKYIEVSSAVYVFQFLFMIGFSGVIVWGLVVFTKKH